MLSVKNPGYGKFATLHIRSKWHNYHRRLCRKSPTTFLHSFLTRRRLVRRKTVVWPWKKRPCFLLYYDLFFSLRFFLELFCPKCRPFQINRAHRKYAKNVYHNLTFFYSFYDRCIWRQKVSWRFFLFFYSFILLCFYAFIWYIWKYLE